MNNKHSIHSFHLKITEAKSNPRDTRREVWRSGWAGAGLGVCGKMVFIPGENIGHECALLTGVT